jgi:uroporphyrinogen decarboxylase
MGLLRQDEMTRDERIIALMKREPIDRITFGYRIFTGFSALNCGYTITDMFTNPRKCFDAMSWTAEQYGWQMTPMIIGAALDTLEWGGDIKWPTSEFAQAPIVRRYPVATEEDVWNLKIPDVKTAGIIPQIVELAKLSVDSGAKFINFQLKEPFESAAQICGVEKFCRWMLRKPKLVHRLLQMAFDFNLEFARYWIDTFGLEHCNLVFTGAPTTSNQVISPKMFETFALPYMKEFHEKLLVMGIKHILCHICGEQNLNLPYWAQIPMGDPGIVSFGHEIDLDAASKYFPNDVLCGNVEPAVIQTGTTEEVYKLSRICIEKGKKHPGGFMLAPGCELPPKAPPHNAWMMMRAINDFGWYK